MNMFAISNITPTLRYKLQRTICSNGGIEMTDEQILKDLAEVVHQCRPDDAAGIAKKALDAGIDPVVAINDGLVVGMGIIGDNYADRKIYLPQVLVAAHAMYEGLDVLLPAIPKGDLADAKKACTAVVLGDVHDIGKNLVKTMLTASGYIVNDLGKDVRPDVIAETIKNDEACVLCLSTLMTPTMDNMAKAVELIRENGYRDKVLITIGGPPTTPAFAEEIGADHRDDNSTAAVKYIDSKIKG